MRRAVVVALLAAPAIARADGDVIVEQPDTVVVEAEAGATVTIVQAPPPLVLAPAELPPPPPPSRLCSIERNRTEYVGHRGCTRFGAWATPMRVPSMVVDLGLDVRDVRVPVTALAARSTGSAPPATSALAPAVTAAFRFGFIARSGFYGGLETEIGGVGGAADPGPQPGLPDPGAGLYVHGALFAGVRGAVGPLSLAGEVAGGGSLVQSSTITYGQPARLGPASTSGLLEARARAELWLNPWLSTGVVIGQSLVDRGEKMGGVVFSFHTRAFAGDRAR